MRTSRSLKRLSVPLLFGAALVAGGAESASAATPVIGWNFIKPAACQGVNVNGVDILYVVTASGLTFFTSSLPARRAPVSVRIGIAALAFVGAAVLSATAWAADSPMAGDQWKPTDETMADLLADGYELVTVVAPSNQSRLYFLRKPGKIAKCKEWAISSAPPPPPMPIAAARRSASVADIPPPDKPVPEMRIDVECAELVQPAPEQKRWGSAATRARCWVVPMVFRDKQEALGGAAALMRTAMLVRARVMATPSAVAQSLVLNTRREQQGEDEGEEKGPDESGNNAFKRQPQRGFEPKFCRDPRRPEREAGNDVEDR